MTDPATETTTNGASKGTIDTTGTATGLILDQDILARLPLSRPTAKGGAVRSFESVADLTPGAKHDDFGVSINGTTSPENRYLVDGLAVNDPSYGINGTPLSLHFVKEIRVISGGYMPEYGRATGGVLDVVTRSGSNELHGAAWFDFSPGALEGERMRYLPAGQTIRTDRDVDLIQGFGARLDGPILKDRLFFSGGVGFGSTRWRNEQNLYRTRIGSQPLVDNTGVPHPEVGNEFEYDENGLPVTELVPGTKEVRPAIQRSFQYVAKLTLLAGADDTLELSLFGAPSSSGGNGTWGIDPDTGAVEGGANAYTNSAHRRESESNGVNLRWSSASASRTLLLDASLGWHHQRAARLPSDGSAIGSKQGLAGQPSVLWQKSSPVHNDLKQFRDIPGGAAACADAIVRDVDNDGDGAPDATIIREPQCPAMAYFSGGPDYIDDRIMDRVHGRVAVTKLFRALGHHTAKGGLDIEQTLATHTKAFSGTVRYAENGSGSAFNEQNRYGFLTAPDTPVVQGLQMAQVGSTQIGAFVQDSWNLLDEVTVNVGVRYDSQYLFSDGGRLALALPYQFSPRVGAVYDFTRRGKSRVFAHYARYHESIPLDMADRAFPGEGGIGARRRAAFCDPVGDGTDCSAALSLASRGRVFGTSFDPNQYWFGTGASSVPVDPGLSPQATDEIVVGAEYELFKGARAGLVYTHTSLVSAIEDMSRDEAASYFIGNPGSGIARDFPAAQRDYDGVNVLFTKTFGDRWLAQVSYTLSFLRGNLSGLYRPETGQLDPNITSEFDLMSLTVNRTGPLPGDRTHEIKAYAARDFRFDEFFPGPGDMALHLGLGYTGRSGAPTSFLGAHPIYGAGEVHILPRGSGDRLPWTNSVDARVQYSVDLARGTALAVTMDVFNIFNFQEPIAVDEDYTFFQVDPIVGGKPVRGPDGKLVPDPASIRGDGTVNPNFGRATAFQAPLTFRFGASVTF